jgi:integrase
MARKFRNKNLPRGILIDRGYVHIRLFPHGRRFQKCVGPVSQPRIIDDAIAKLNDYREQIRLSRFDLQERTRRITVEQACDIYWQLHGQHRPSQRGFRTSLKHIREAWGARYFDEITHEDVERYRTAAEQKRAPSTVNREHTIIIHMPRVFRRWIATKQIKPVLLPDNPGSLVSKAPESQHRRTRVLLIEEFERLQQCNSAQARFVCELAVTTLLRKKDLELLTRDNYNPITRTLSGIQTKTVVPGRSKGRRYCIPIEDPELEARILAAEGYLLDFTNFRRQFEAAVKAANLKDFVFKDLRRTGATWLYKKGMDIKTISLLLGHASTQMTETYLGIVDGHTREAARLLTNTFRTVVNTVVKPTGFPRDSNSQVLEF